MFAYKCHTIILFVIGQQAVLYWLYREAGLVGNAVVPQCQAKERGGGLSGEQHRGQLLPHQGGQGLAVPLSTPQEHAPPPRHITHGGRVHPQGPLQLIQDSAGTGITSPETRSVRGRRGFLLEGLLP